jgi:hypothetical protein
VTPDTVHLLAQMIRHERARLNSVEKWVRSQPRNETCREIVQMITVGRGLLDEYEQKLSHYEVAPNGTVTPEQEPAVR